MPGEVEVVRGSMGPKGSAFLWEIPGPVHIERRSWIGSRGSLALKDEEV